MPRSTEAALVLAADMLQEPCIFFSYLICLYVEGTCGAEGSLQAPEPAWGICSFLLHEHTAYFYITWASCFHPPSWQPALSRPLSVVYTNYYIILLLYYFHKGKSFLSTSILEKQTDTSKSQRRGKNESLVIILPLEDLEFIFCLSRDTYHICRALLVHTKLHTKYKLYHISLSLLAQIKAI